MKVCELLSDGTAQLKAANGESPFVDARLLLAHVLGKSKEWLIIHDHDSVAEPEIENYKFMIDRRKKGEPVAYIIGYRDFWDLKLRCNNTTLIPQPDTEVLVERALKYANKNSSILDLGTGTGAVALALKRELPGAMIEGVDLFEDVVKLAETNARLNNLAVEFKVSNWFSAVEGKFDLIVANPPYIAPDDEHLSCGDVRFEPESALVAAENGLSDLRSIVEQSSDFLNDQGILLVEHGYDQGTSVRALFKEHGFKKVVTTVDYGGNDRVTEGVFYEC
ncbi:MAG: peptide chain release factor N(5)-glutamine methyltransferase [Succinivibrionaceae bacterium]|nr:peptide chain release factor N(5)-glutamine methyltransferase [Succinivibrionaceae bacterium]